MTYPPEIRSLCLDLRAAGYSLSEIAEQVGPASSTIHKWEKDEKNFPPEKWTDERRQMVLNRWEKGHSVSWLARRYCISRTTIYRWAKIKLKM